ncbi:MAG: metallophosphoesterase [Proteobacteria bacterium]|nr:metallophosphoesterase [Pseudomonadota bacterium]
MAKLAVVHLSDIHIHGKSDTCFEAAAQIASSCYELIRGADECLLAITGDIAFSGAKDQYKAAVEYLLHPIVSGLEKEAGKKVFVSIAPGNHDCVLRPIDEVRETLIGAIVEEPSKASSEAIVIACTNVLANFFTFAEAELFPSAQFHSKLLWQQMLTVAGKQVLVTSLNAAWMSRLPEQQGQLVFPLERFDRQLRSDAPLHLALIHHPFNWYNQAAYQTLRKHLRHSCTAVLSGHEHVGNAGKLDDEVSGVSLFFESAALQPHEKDAVAGFSVYVFDLDAKNVETHSFALDSSGVHDTVNPVRHSWKEKEPGATPEVSMSFAETLNDAGGNFSHTAKERLTLEDVFVWPDLRDWDMQEVNKQKTKSSSSMIADTVKGHRFIIYGDEKSGKTTLLYRLFRDLIGQGLVPVYLSAHSTSIKAENDPEKRINRAIEEQYGNPEAVHRSPKELRVLLLDDVDRLRSGIHTLPMLLDYAEQHFASVSLTASASFEIANLASREAMIVLAPFQSHDLMPFGLKLRHQLIKKWCGLAPVGTAVELDRRVNEVESIVNAVIGRPSTRSISSSCFKAVSSIGMAKFRTAA